MFVLRKTGNLVFNSPMSIIKCTENHSSLKGRPGHSQPFWKPIGGNNAIFYASDITYDAHTATDSILAQTNPRCTSTLLRMAYYIYLHVTK
jgi:hypothetical protein